MPTGRLGLCMRRLGDASARARLTGRSSPVALQLVSGRCSLLLRWASLISSGERTPSHRWAKRCRPSSAPRARGLGANLQESACCKVTRLSCRADSVVRGAGRSCQGTCRRRQREWRTGERSREAGDRWATGAEALAYPLIEQGIAAVPFRGKGLGFRVGRSTHCWSARHSPSGCPAERRRAARRGRRTSD